MYVIHFRAPKSCAATVRSLCASDGVQVDVTVMDNGGLGDVGAIQARAIHVGSNLGYAGGANRCIADWRAHHPTARYLVVACHDVEVEAPTLGNMLVAMDGDLSLGILAPEFWQNGHRSGRAASSQPGSNQVWEHEWVSGALMLIRRDCVDAIAGFDASLGSYHEDVDFCRRARAAGWRVGMLNGAKATGRGSVASFGHRTWLMARNEILVTCKLDGKKAGALRSVRHIGGGGKTLALAFAHCSRSERMRRFSAGGIRIAAGVCGLAKIPFRPPTGVAR